MTVYKAAVKGLGRMGSTFDDDMVHGGSVFLPYCHGPAYFHSPQVELVAGADLHDGQRELFGQRWQVPEDHLYTCCQSAKVGRIGTRENYCYGEPALSSLAAEL